MAKGETYEEFVDKFKPKKTTDDCYTPEPVYNAVAEWACKRYDLDPAKIVRPFWPGADFEMMDYPTDCVVLDNPPFSIMAKILNVYNAYGIKYFLFCHALTVLHHLNITSLVVGTDITYNNGARIRTSFYTNLSPYLIECAPELLTAIKSANKQAQQGRKPSAAMPKYQWPENVLGEKFINQLSRAGQQYVLQRGDAIYTSHLDNMRATTGKTPYGGALLLSEKAAAEKAAAEKAAAKAKEAIPITLSRAELEIVKSLGASDALPPPKTVTMTTSRPHTPIRLPQQAKLWEIQP